MPGQARDAYSGGDHARIATTKFEVDGLVRSGPRYSSTRMAEGTPIGSRRR